MAQDDNYNKRSGDLILAPNEFAFISDETKGAVDVYVGPNKQSLAGTDQCVVFDLKSKRFKRIDLGAGVQTFMTAPEGWYVVLKNPAEGEKHPGGSGKQSTPSLRVGKKVNIPGPASFALWPGQMAKVVQGHNLRTNEYLLVRVYDEVAAKNNFNKQVLVTQTDPTAATAADANKEVSGKEAKQAKQSRDSQSARVTETAEVMRLEDLTMGKMFVIKGTEVSFYIPPTGIEVVPEQVNGQERYVREAVTLEALEYCLLLDQSGSKRYEYGPAVVFPKPTEKFVEAPIKSDPEKAKAKKFSAKELTETSGVHVAVIADYTDMVTGKQIKSGEELFITGASQKIYFPRAEHAIIKYGQQDVHYGIAIPVGEARYVMNRTSGAIRLVKGPQVFLPDPRHEVIINRAIPLALCELMYPGNAEAIAVNAARLENDNQDIYSGSGGGGMLNDRSVIGSDSYGASAAVNSPDMSRKVMIRGASKASPGDAFDRKNKFTAPRSIVLNNKFDGAVTMDVFTGFAVKLVRKDGSKRVLVGPVTAMLEYDETPQVLSFSRGKPKGTTNPVRTVYLKVTNNRVGDIIEVETRDATKVNITVSYRLNFTGDKPESWFEVDDYVKFLCDNMRSRIRSAVRKKSIQEFYNEPETMLRDIILGAAGKDGEKRTGTSFEENKLHVYDVEILGVKIMDKLVEDLLMNSRRSELQQTIQLSAAKRDLEFTKETEQMTQQRADAQFQTRTKALELAKAEAAAKHVNDTYLLENQGLLTSAKAAQRLIETKSASEVTEEMIRRQRIEDAATLEKLRAEADLTIRRLEAETNATKERAAAISEKFITGLQAAADNIKVSEIAKALGPLNILGINTDEGGAAGILTKILAGTPMGERLLQAAAPNGKNGNGAAAATAHRA